MALRDQPYLPLYIQDFLTDEKLMECSASSLGIYIKIMCILHKQEEYGVLLLKQKDKQSDKQILNFASKIAKSMPYDQMSVSVALTELIEERVLIVEGDRLLQKRMMKDGLISDERSKAGKKGGKETQSKTGKSDKFAKAKIEANSEYEIEYENEVVNKIMSFFNFSQVTHHKKFVECTTFVKVLTKNKTVEHFKKQFESYKKLKSENSKYVHSFDKFLGSITELFEDGAWNSENWVEKLSASQINKESNNDRPMVY